MECWLSRLHLHRLTGNHCCHRCMFQPLHLLRCKWFVPLLHSSHGFYCHIYHKKWGIDCCSAIYIDRFFKRSIAIDRHISIKHLVTGSCYVFRIINLVATHIFKLPVMGSIPSRRGFLWPYALKSWYSRWWLGHSAVNPCFLHHVNQQVITYFPPSGQGVVVIINPLIT